MRFTASYVANLPKEEMLTLNSARKNVNKNTIKNIQIILKRKQYTQAFVHAAVKNSLIMEDLIKPTVPEAVLKNITL